MKQLLNQIENCTLCSGHLPFSPRPVIQVGKKARILIIGQAPGLKVQQTGIAWNDKSGDTLRNWLGVEKEQFYNPNIFGLVPMGFCYPGKGKSGDLPPRKECTPTWHKKLLESMPHVELILLMGLYAQRYYLQHESRATLTENVLHFEEFLPQYFPLVHPSPRNAIWQKKNPWFKKDVIPHLQKRIESVLNM